MELLKLDVDRVVICAGGQVNYRGPCPSGPSSRVAYLGGIVAKGRIVVVEIIRLKADVLLGLGHDA